MGNSNRKNNSDYNAHNLPKGKDSVKGTVFVLLKIK